MWHFLDYDNKTCVKKDHLWNRVGGKEEEGHDNVILSSELISDCLFEFHSE